MSEGKLNILFPHAHVSVHAMSIKSIIVAQYGVGSHQLTTLLKRFKLQLSSSKNRTLFLERCIFHRLIPKFLNIRSPVKSRHAFSLVKKLQHNLLRETLTLARRKIHTTAKKIADANAKLKNDLSTEHYSIIERITDESYRRDFEKRKNKLRRKFDKMKEKSQRQNIQTSMRASTIKDPILQLQTGALPQDAIEVLKLGPKFAVTPKEIPKMEIITSIEKAALQLERNGNRDKASTLRHKVANILLHA